MTQDKIYATDQDGDEPFRFNQAVADAFPDMLQRSIPGYAASIEAIGSLAARYVTEGSLCYDLGCSLGAATIAMRQGIRVPDCRIIAIDNAPAMLKRCKEIVSTEDQQSATPVETRLSNIEDTDISNASMVVMNYTLQFLDIDSRDAIIARIFDGLLPGGLFLLSEKVIDEDPSMEELLIDLHHEHKRRNDYSLLEVSRKRAALENVLIPETVTAHRQRLVAAGFAHTAVWLRYFNFVSIVAIKK
jgi:tRNA (cmo5U34)-methyltransferase